MAFVSSPKLQRHSALFISVILALLFVFTTMQVFASDDAVSADLTNSSKTVDQAEAQAGDTVHYTIVLSNTGGSGNVIVTDTLDANLTYVVDSFIENPVIGVTPVISNGMIIWDGFVGNDQTVELSFDAVLTDTLLVDDVVTNTVWIDDEASVISRTAVTTIIDAPPAAPADLSGSSKTVDNAETAVGSELGYTITLSNSGGLTATNTLVTDTLPTELSYITNTLTVNPDTGTAQFNAGQITWQGDVPPTSTITIQFQAQLTNTLTEGDIVTNTVSIAYDGTSIERLATTEIIAYRVYMPIIYKPLPILTLQLTQAPNSNNEWVVSWANNYGSGLEYELQEAQSVDFSGATTINSSDTSNGFRKDLSFNNVYYCRVRPVAGDLIGNWSNIVQVISGYRDDFTDASSGWATRRISLLEEQATHYGVDFDGGKHGDVLILIRADAWDWMLASPLRPAPAVPYAIEFKMRIHDGSNLVSGGMVFGGDWNGQPCPEIGNVYDTKNCFNNFYTYNFIFYGPIKLLHEQVDLLYWCPNCGGAKLKRLGPNMVLEGSNGEGIISCHSNWPTTQCPEDGNPAEDWHTYRVEVREDGARLYIDNNFKYHFTNTSYINGRYFGAFASSDEYQPSIWFYDYFQVTPLD